MWHGRPGRDHRSGPNGHFDDLPPNPTPTHPLFPHTPTTLSHFSYDFLMILRALTMTRFPRPPCAPRSSPPPITPTLPLPRRPPLLHRQTATGHFYRRVTGLDGGLTPGTKSRVTSPAHRPGGSHTPGWDINFPDRHTIPNYFKTVLARPFLPRHFPEYDRYIFLDADLWLQDWNAIALLLLASERDVMAIVPAIPSLLRHTIHPSKPTRPVQRLPPLSAKLRRDHRQNHARPPGDPIPASGP